MTFADRVAPELDGIRAKVQIKLANFELPSDRETLGDACAAIACLIRDPAGLSLQTVRPPPSEQAYADITWWMTFADRAFSAEINYLRSFVAAWQQNPELRAQLSQQENTANLGADERSSLIREMILHILVHGNDEEIQRGEGGDPIA
jgi:hypothetical protein